MCSALFSVRDAQACSRLQPSYKTSHNFLKKLTRASLPIRDMLINLDDEKDDDETSSKRSKGKGNKAVILNTYKFNPCLTGVLIHRLSFQKPVIQHSFTEKTSFFSKIPVSIAICCLRI